MVNFIIANAQFVGELAPAPLVAPAMILAIGAHFLAVPLLLSLACIAADKRGGR